MEALKIGQMSISPRLTCRRLTRSGWWLDVYKRQLLGVPLAHKDIFVTRDFVSTAGSKMLDGYRSPFDATVVSRLSEAGAVTLGKLYCYECAMG